MDTESARERILDAAEELFYARGIQAVGMDAIRSASGVTLRRLYQEFPAKDDLVEAYLARRDARWLQNLAASVAASPARTPQERLLAVFDWLEEWFGQPDFHGCAFINAFGELAGTSPRVAAAARRHKAAFHAYLHELATAPQAEPEAETGAKAGVEAATAAAAPTAVSAQIALLAEGAMTMAAISGAPSPARQAKQAAHALLTLATEPSAA